MLKIAMVSGDDVAADGGDVVDDTGRQFSAALAGLGHDVTAYERQADRLRHHNPAGRGYQTVETCTGLSKQKTPQEFLPFVGDWAGELTDIWMSDPPDIVHAQGWLGGLAAQLAARRPGLGLPTVQSFYGLDATQGFARRTERARLEPLLARNATWVTGGSGGDVDKLAKLRRSRARLSVLSTGVDVERFAPVGPQLPAHGDLHRVLCLAPNPLPCHGLDRVIQTMPKLCDAELVIAETADTGGHYVSERAALEQLAAKLRVNDRIRFAGRVNADELPTLVRSADVAVCTPRQSPRATSALQAMASAVVVVAADIGALTDTVIHGVTGFLVSPDKPVELVTALKTLLAQRFQRQSMGAAGRSRAMSRFTWDRIALEAQNIYQQASSRRSPQVMNTGGERRVSVR